jgi:hypothetical protein
LSFWKTMKSGRSSANRPAWPGIPVRWSMPSPTRGSARLTPHELDGLFEFLTPDPDDHTDESLFLNTVDRAIAEIAGPRGRRRAHRGT